MYQNGLGYMSATYPNPYPPVTVPPLTIILIRTGPTITSEKRVKDEKVYRFFPGRGRRV